MAKYNFHLIQKSCLLFAVSTLTNNRNKLSALKLALIFINVEKNSFRNFGITMCLLVVPPTWRSLSCHAGPSWYFKLKQELLGCGILFYKYHVTGLYGISSWKEYSIWMKSLPYQPLCHARSFSRYLVTGNSAGRSGLMASQGEIIWGGCPELHFSLNSFHLL